ncbi:peptidyl-prolyl cis-trans isomerase-like 4 [Octopus sinensis]|uniref:Peptidyl-prolyl cis-trans isomerase n=1 Tax=Octopus sinensis TaxID=2607531 RepID=A0A6P7TYV5_9MOLL|nr:peptidyl-prolyl cis-trans isomerase-like 4 [Octopus sinensis]
MSVTINTSVGNLKVLLFTDERPRCIYKLIIQIRLSKFLKLCKMKYYNFCLFHFIKVNIQNNPTAKFHSSNWGSHSHRKRRRISLQVRTKDYPRYLYGDDGKYFEAEQTPKITHKRQGLLSMVNNGQKLHGSQFFITLANSLDSLDGKHTVFGSVCEETFDVLSKLNDTMTGDDGTPYRDVRILHTWVEEDPFDEPPGLIFPPNSPTTNEAAEVETGRIKYDEELDTCISKEEVGDLPAPEVKPAENILFVCKLNPLTSDEDLEVIFSRFGNILKLFYSIFVRCEIIREKGTGKSLQYAFVEFENV